MEHGTWNMDMDMEMDVDGDMGTGMRRRTHSHSAASATHEIVTWLPSEAGRLDVAHAGGGAAVRSTDVGAR